MRIPEALFPLINRIVKLLLESPAHGLMSGSVLTIHYKGRRTGRPRWTPLRYLAEPSGLVTCLTTKDTAWWQNFREPSEVELQIAGRRVPAEAHSVIDDRVRIRTALRAALDRFPGDAPYHGLAKSHTEDQFAAAVAEHVLVEFTLRS